MHDRSSCSDVVCTMPHVFRSRLHESTLSPREALSLGTVYELSEAQSKTLRLFDSLVQPTSEIPCS